MAWRGCAERRANERGEEVGRLATRKGGKDEEDDDDEEVGQAEGKTGVWVACVG